MKVNGPRMLEGYQVLDFTHFVAGPTCTRILAELGAKVIKVEPAPHGDRTRAMGLRHNGQSTYYFQHNHSKLSLALDVKKPRARELLLAMIPKIDVVVENYAPGVMRNMGFGYEALSELNPKLVMCSISMAGQDGPLASKPGYDYMGQSYAGVTDQLGEPERTPIMPPMAIGDVSTGVAAAMAVGFALLNRERTGQGQYIDASILDTYFHMHDMVVPLVSLRPERFKAFSRGGPLHPLSSPNGIFKANGGYIFITALEHQWPQLVRAMGMPELATDERFKDHRSRTKNARQLQEVIERWLGGFPDRDSALAALDKERVPCAPVLTLAEAISHPHLRERHTVRSASDPELGEFDLPAMPVRFSGWEQRLGDSIKASCLGQDNETVLRALLDMPDAEIRRLYEEGVLTRYVKPEQN
jgi:CoA:oxalate CoA-transferase